jgi:OOP family OmpA-OmpF porin
VLLRQGGFSGQSAAAKKHLDTGVSIIMTRTVALLTAILTTVSLSACSGTRPAEPGTCAIVGAGIGGVSGVAIGANVADDENEGAGIGVAAGAVVGAITGYAICAMMPAAAEPAPAPVAQAPAPHARVVKKTITLPSVDFAFNSAELGPHAKEVLATELVSELKEDPSLTVLVEGHTDSVGGDAYNQKLSERRAASVKSYLVSQGISASRIETKGYGETQPIADNETAAGRAKNRRVDVKELQ